MQKIAPPKSIESLLHRAHALSGRKLAEIAAECRQPIPSSQKRAKGWIGQLLELALGADGGSQALHDFLALGVELKSLPIAENGYARESTYVCTVPLTDLTGCSWSESWIARKLHRVLWIPVEAFRHQSLGERRVGQPILWQPNSWETSALQADWEELVEFIALGDVEEINGQFGQYLQIRPKAADAKARRLGINVDGYNSLTLPRGFYLRPKFTKQILDRNLYFVSE
ncbi:MAG TPA: DNA mismatch repair endonuclease MutH [Gammaproteobacteria bacterium]|nr:DNA mismatch repair endonuclease MutH [Gammaproteobacteria bacterium]